MNKEIDESIELVEQMVITYKMASARLKERELTDLDKEVLTQMGTSLLTEAMHLVISVDKWVNANG